MKPFSCHIVIASGNTEFSTDLKGILKIIENENEEFSAVILEAPTMDKIEKVLNRDTHILFIDAAIVVKESKRLAKMWKKLKLDCALTLLFSRTNETELQKVIYKMEKRKSLPLDIYVLKDNYPQEFIKRLIMRLVNQSCISIA